MGFKKQQLCTNCDKPDEFSDETLCHDCIELWKKVLEKRAYDKGINDLLKDIETHYFQGNHYYQEVCKLANDLKNVVDAKSVTGVDDGK